MAKKVKAFRSLVYSKFDSEAQFARAMGWERQRVNKLSNGVRQPNLEEVDTMAKALCVSPMELMYIFLENKSPNRQQVV